MQSNVIAPWATPVSGARYPALVADLVRLADTDSTWTYEIVEGRLFRMPGSGSRAARISTRLIVALSVFTDAHTLGEVTGPDGTYDLTLPGDSTETVLVPDVAFVRAGRLAPVMAPGSEGYPRLAPDLVAEVVSPSQYHPEMAAKARLYLERGVRLVWAIWPEQSKVEVWRSSSLSAPVATLSDGDSLDGLDVVPGFMEPIARLLR